MGNGGFFNALVTQLTFCKTGMCDLFKSLNSHSHLSNTVFKFWTFVCNYLIRTDLIVLILFWHQIHYCYAVKEWSPVSKND